jgi:hypothetical protein
VHPLDAEGRTIFLHFEKKTLIGKGPARAQERGDEDPDDVEDLSSCEG